MLSNFYFTPFGWLFLLRRERAWLQPRSVPLHRHLPHLASFDKCPVVYLTAVVNRRRPVLASQAPFEVLTAIWQSSPEIDGWYVGDFLLMPDHLHLFAQPALDGKSLAGWVQTWKSIAARRLRPITGTGRLWQEDYFDRFIRSQKDYDDRWQYVQMNPIRRCLCQEPEEWPWKGRLTDLQYRKD